MPRSLYLPLFTMLALLCTATSSHGQGTDLGTIRGTVTDSSGAIIPAASVTVTDVLTSRDRVTQTNGDGYYEMFGLNPGTYKVTVTATGMSKTEITNVLIKGSDTVSANAVLKISSAQESVVVNDESAIIDTEDQTISQTLDNQAVIDLPRDSRNVYSFLYLNPNITQADADGNFKFIGAQSYGASFSLDGQRSNGGIFGQQYQRRRWLERFANILSFTENTARMTIRSNLKSWGHAVPDGRTLTSCGRPTGQLGCEPMEDSVFGQGGGPLVSFDDSFFSRKNPGGSNGFNFSGETYGISISRRLSRQTKPHQVWWTVRS